MVVQTRFPFVVALYLKALAKQMISESGLFPINSDEWVSVVLKLSRAVCDNLTEEAEDDVRLPFTRPGMELGGEGEDGW